MNEYSLAYNKFKYRKLVSAALAIIMVSMFFCGRRAPWAWGYTSYILNWDFGFLPRTFVGTIFSFVLRDAYYSQTTINTVMYVAEFLFVFYLLYIIYQLCIKEWNFFAFVTLLIFSFSTFPMFYFMLVGYLDHFGILCILVIIQVAVKASSKKTWLISGLLCLLSVLILETNVFIVCPVVVTIYIIKIILEKEKWNFVETKKLILSFLIYLPTLLYCLYVLTFQASSQQLNQIRQSITDRRLDFPLILDYALSFWDGTSRITIPKNIPYVPNEIILYAFFPIGILSIYLCCINIPILKQIFIVSLQFLCSLVAYLTNFVATDYNRFSMYMFLCPMLVSIFIYQKQGTKSLHADKKYIIVILMFTFFVLCTCSSYRLWTFNQTYYEPWWELLWNKLMQ